jgi:RNA polymerase sigma-70 factor
VRVSLARQVVSIKRLRQHAFELDEDTAQQLGAIDPELAMVRRRYGQVFRTAFHDAFAELSAEQRNILALHFVDGLTLDRVAPVFRISRATARRRLLEAKSTLLDAFLTLVGARLEATPAEIQSLLAIVRSTLYGSLARLLRGS